MTDTFFLSWSSNQRHISFSQQGQTKKEPQRMLKLLFNCSEAFFFSWNRSSQSTEERKKKFRLSSFIVDVPDSTILLFFASLCFRHWVLGLFSVDVFGTFSHNEQMRGLLFKFCCIFVVGKS